MKLIIRMMAGVSGPWTAISARHCVPQALSLLLVSLMLAGCSTSNLAILSPASGFATGQRDLIYFAIGLMLIVLIPVWLLAFWFPFRYREREGTRGHHPEWTNVYDTLHIALSTHDAGGAMTGKDHALAAAINGILG